MKITAILVVVAGWVDEVPVSYRRRIGASKISGTVQGVVLAGTKILYTIFRTALLPHGSSSESESS